MPSFMNATAASAKAFIVSGSAVICSSPVVDMESRRLTSHFVRERAAPVWARRSVEMLAGPVFGGARNNYLQMRGTGLGDDPSELSGWAASPAWPRRDTMHTRHDSVPRSRREQIDEPLPYREYGLSVAYAYRCPMMRKRKPVEPKAERSGEDLLAVPNFQATQRDALEVQLFAKELGITPAQLRSLRLAYGRNTAKIREAAKQLRQL